MLSYSFICLAKTNQDTLTSQMVRVSITQTDLKERSSNIQNLSLCIKTLNGKKVRIYSVQSDLTTDIHGMFKKRTILIWNHNFICLAKTNQDTLTSELMLCKQILKKDQVRFKILAFGSKPWIVKR